MEQELNSISLFLFGTEDYESILSILPPYDGAVKEFKQQEKEIRKKYQKGKDE